VLRARWRLRALGGLWGAVRECGRVGDGSLRHSRGGGGWPVAVWSGRSRTPFGSLTLCHLGCLATRNGRSGMLTFEGEPASNVRCGIGPQRHAPAASSKVRHGCGWSAWWVWHRDEGRDAATALPRQPGTGRLPLAVGTPLIPARGWIPICRVSLRRPIVEPAPRLSGWRAGARRNEIGGRGP
jgi:hypothetical protein